MPTIGVNLKEDIIQKIDRFASANGLTRSDVLKNAIAQYLSIQEGNSSDESLLSRIQRERDQKRTMSLKEDVYEMAKRIAGGVCEKAFIKTWFKVFEENLCTHLKDTRVTQSEEKELSKLYDFAKKLLDLDPKDQDTSKKLKMMISELEGDKQ